MASVLVKLPPKARRGEVIEIRAMIRHPMETGYRPGADGAVLPRNIIRRFTCRYNGDIIFSAELFPAIAANPNIIFHTVAVESGSLSFTWEGDNGFRQTETRNIQVEG